MKLIRWSLAAAILALSGCAIESGNPRTTLTERQRDSVIARSALPGAGVVGRALVETDHAAGRTAMMDSLAH